ncbi:hypothetical protein PQZ45_03115 [Candidatus Pelagibacter sp.]|nr:hypothetical protein [Candidatus Pelagibacter sp.]
MKKMGGIEGIMSFMPGVSKMKSQMDASGIDESVISKNEAIILSMTKKKERGNPKIIDGSRKKNELLMALEQMRPLSINC